MDRGDGRGATTLSGGEGAAGDRPGPFPQKAAAMGDGSLSE